MRSIKYIGIILLAPVAGLATEWFEGENLLLEPPDKSRFETYVKNEPGWKSTMWVSKTHEGGSTYVVNIVDGEPSSLAGFRNSQDKPGKQSCDSFSTTPIDDSYRNGYDSLFWETSCEIQGMTIRSIQLAIAGRDSLYHVRRLWKIPVIEEEFEDWKEIIRKVSVCDTRQESNPCPTGWRKVR